MSYSHLNRKCHRWRVLLVLLGLTFFAGIPQYTQAICVVDLDDLQIFSSFWLAAGPEGITITELDLAGNQIELANAGTTNVNMTSWWMCNRVNGSPSYSALSNATIDTGLSTATSLDVAPGEILVLNISSSLLPDANGEFGLYNSSSFTSSTAIEDYILWGADGVRDLVAANAQIWIDNDSIDVSGLGVGETIQLSPGTPGNRASDYFIGPSNLGTVDIDISVDFNGDNMVNLNDFDALHQNWLDACPVDWPLP